MLTYIHAAALYGFTLPKLTSSLIIGWISGLAQGFGTTVKVKINFLMPSKIVKKKHFRLSTIQFDKFFMQKQMQISFFSRISKRNDKLGFFAIIIFHRFRWQLTDISRIELSRQILN